MRKPKIGRIPTPDIALLQQIADVGARLVKAPYGALGVKDPLGDGFAHFITTGLDGKAREAIGPPPEGKGLLGMLMRDPRPLRVADISKDRRAAALPPNAPRMGSFLGVPIVSGGEVRGALYFTQKPRAPEFHPADARLAECVARLAAQAVEGVAGRAEIERALDLFRSVLDEKSKAVVVTNPAREIVFWNAGARRLFGHAEAEALGQPFTRLLVPPEEAPARRRGFHPRIQRKMENGETAQEDCVRLHKDGRRIPIRMTISPIRHRAAGILAITCVGFFERL